MQALHDLQLVAPWYLWPNVPRRPATPEENARGRRSAPVFQKYASGSVVSDFLRDPSACLNWEPDDDVAWKLVDSATRIKFTPLRKKLVKHERDDKDVRALFLPSHNRFYLVVCEIHCDVPGFPCADADRICEAGLVVRRRVGKDGKLRQGWFADPNFPKFGTWRPLDPDKKQETPEHEFGEATVALCPLLPDRRKKPQHAGQGRCIYFAVVPTSSSEVEPDGTPRYDHQSDYEIRCYVRHHRPECPRRSPCRCCGQLHFSLPTETYRLAAPFDLIGTSYRPVTVHLPDLAMMAAQALAPRRPGAPPRSLAPLAFAGSAGARKLPPVRLPGPGSAPAAGSAPAVSHPAAPEPDHTWDELLPNLEFDTLLSEEKDQQFGMLVKQSRVLGGTATTSDGTCFFAIPLITIVATFVLKLFMVLVMFLFNLYWMLALKLCLPFVAIGGNLKVAAGAGFGKLGDSLADFEAQMSASVQVDFGGGLSLRPSAGGGDPDLSIGSNIGGSMGAMLGLRTSGAVNVGASLASGGGGAGFRGGASFGGRL